MFKRKMTKKTNNDLQSIIHNAKDRETLIPLKTGGECEC